MTSAFLIPKFWTGVSQFVDMEAQLSDARPVYEPLSHDGFRLLQILRDDDPAGSCSGEIRCKLITRPLHTRVRYTAISYTWGSPPASCRIVLNGRSTLVRKNLWRFLLEARKFTSDHVGWLWIDALCIDQSNIEERAQQVGLMPEIYRNAERVIIWLGPAYGSSEEAMDGLARYAACRRARKNVWNITGRNAGTAIGLLCRRAYWTRLWVFQEVILARKIQLMCGDRLVPWEPFREMLLSVPDGRLEASIQCQIIRDSPAMSIVSSTAESLSDVSLFDLMIDVKSLHCAEARDRVYALLGIVTRGRGGIRPDYEIPIPVLLNAVLRDHHRNIAQPTSLEEIGDQCRQLDTLLARGNDEESIFRLRDDKGNVPNPPEENIAEYPVGRTGSPITLWWASYYGHTAVEELLMNDEYIDTYSWLQRSVKGGSRATVKLLLDKGLDVTSKRGSGVRSEAIQAAAKEGHTEIVKLLLECDPGPILSINLALAALDATEGGFCDIVRLLLESRASIESAALGAEYESQLLGIAVKRRHMDLIKLFLSNGADPDGHTLGFPLSFAASNGMVDVMELLLDHGACINGFVTGHPCPLVTASDLGHTEVVRLLLSRGADVDDPRLRRVRYNVDTDPPTPLGCAASRGHVEIVRLLLLNGADIRGSTQECRGSRLNKTPLELAAEHGHTEVVALLLQYGTSNVNLRRELWVGQALRFALDGEHHGIVEILRSLPPQPRLPWPDALGSLLEWLGVRESP